MIRGHPSTKNDLFSVSGNVRWRTIIGKNPTEYPRLLKYHWIVDSVWEDEDSPLEGYFYAREHVAIVCVYREEKAHMESLFSSLTVLCCDQPNPMQQQQQNQMIMCARYGPDNDQPRRCGSSNSVPWLCRCPRR